MKKWFMISLVMAVALALGFGAAFAQDGGYKLSGPHHQFNIIGKPHGWDCSGNCAESNGKTIMVDLVTDILRIDGVTPDSCLDDNTIVDDQPGQKIVYEDQALDGKTKIYFNSSDDCVRDENGVVQEFDIVDRNATAPDLEAHVCLPTADDGKMKYDVFVRILGKPNRCMDINGLVYYEGDWYEGSGWYWSGSIHLARKGGKSQWVKANDLFDIWWCSEPVLDEDGSWLGCDLEEEYSVFSDFFLDYMWQINNRGARIVQVRFYEADELWPELP